ncbi:MAG: glycosyltransferase, partial [Actinomycetota bacterium]
MASVSVIVPTYERPDLLRLALDSALAQTYDDFVILVGDNSESDETERLVTAIDDPRIRYHRNRPGLGGQGNWLDLVARAATPLVASLHDDDVWEPDFLAATVPAMLADDRIAMSFSDFWLIDGAGTRLDDYTAAESARTNRASMPAGTIEADLSEGLRLVAVWNAPQPAYAAVLRREPTLAIDFPDDVNPLYDIWISYSLVKAGHLFHYVPRRLTNYRVHPGAITSTGFARAEDAVFTRILEENPTAGPVLDEIRAYWADLQWSRATDLMSTGRDSRPLSQQQFRMAADGGIFLEDAVFTRI